MTSARGSTIADIDAVAVCVPVHDEEEKLPACLAALDGALAALPSTVIGEVVVVLDACHDGSDIIAERWCRTVRAEGVGRGSRDRRRVLRRHFRNVGRARAAGMDLALAGLSLGTAARGPAPGPEPNAADRAGDEVRARGIWLATTDADSLVPPGWLTAQLQLAATGVDAIAGSIEVSDWSEHPPGFAERFRQFYEPLGSGDEHEHVHGANLGLRADAYLAVGGFEPLVTGEDHALWHALDRAARSRVSSRKHAVVTSARPLARAPDGFSGFLAKMGRVAESAARCLASGPAMTGDRSTAR